MKILILEDNLVRIEKFKELFRNQELWIFDNVKSAFEFCQVEDIQLMLLDHDLGNQIWVDSNEDNTGYQFVKKLIENQLQKNSLYYIHSSNPIGANKMLNLLLDNKFDGIWFPYHLWRF
jgi:CheY-like chemotaxis protein